MRFVPDLNLALLPFLIDTLKTPDKRKKIVNGVICRLLTTQMLGEWPPVIVITSQRVVPSQKHVAEKLLADQLAHGCQAIWRNVFGIFYPEQMGHKLVKEREAGSDGWTANTSGPASSSPQCHLCQIHVVPAGHKSFVTPFCEISCTLWMKNVL